MRRLLPIVLAIIFFTAISGCSSERTNEDSSISLSLYNLSNSAGVDCSEPPPQPIPDPFIEFTQDIQEPQEEVSESTHESVAISPPLTMQGDWAGYIYGEPEYDWDDGQMFAVLLRMQDEEHGLLGFCADMSNKGSGCAAVSVTFINDSEILVSVDKWFYRTNHDVYNILPQDFTVSLNYYWKQTIEDGEDYSSSFFGMTPVPGYNNSSPDALAGTAGSGERLSFARINEEDGLFPKWYHQYDGLNGCLEGIFGFGECGADNINTSNVFVFPLNDGSFRLRYIYTEFGYPFMGDNGQWGIPEYSLAHDIDAGGYLSMYPWICFWSPENNTEVVNASDNFTAFYQNQYIPNLIRLAQAYKWEDGFEERDINEWDKDHYWDYLKIVMYKKLVFTAQEVIEGRFDGDQNKVREMLDRLYKPDLVELNHYDPECDPNAYILYTDLDANGEVEKLVLRAYPWDGDPEMPLDSAQLIINGEVYFNLYGETVHPKIFIVDIDNSDNMKEFAIVLTQEDGYSFIRLFRYNDRFVTEIGGVWGNLDNEFTGLGMITEFPGDGSIITYVPGDRGFTREVIHPEEQHGGWLGGIYFY